METTVLPHKCMVAYIDLLASDITLARVPDIGDTTFFLFLQCGPLGQHLSLSLHAGGGDSYQACPCYCPGTMWMLGIFFWHTQNLN